MHLIDIKQYLFLLILVSLFATTHGNNKAYILVSCYIVHDTIINDNADINDTIIEPPSDGRRPRGRQLNDTIQPVIIQTDTTLESQDAPEEEKEDDGKRKTRRKERDYSNHSPTRAAMLSATFPGAGQVYNRKYWKVPIIYVGFGAVIYYANAYNNEYQKWQEAYTYRVDGNPNTVDNYPDFSDDYLRRAMNYFRRNLELTYIAGGFIYLLGILDATVDAHLLDFDVSEDLSLNIKPAVIPSASSIGYKGISTGLTLSFRF